MTYMKISKKETFILQQTYLYITALKLKTLKFIFVKIELFMFPPSFFRFKKL